MLVLSGHLARVSGVFHFFDVYRPVSEKLLLEGLNKPPWWMDILPCCRCSVAVGGPLWSPASYTDGLPTLDSLVILAVVYIITSADFR